MLITLLSDATLLLVNVNFPRQPRGLIWTRASVRQYDGTIVPTQDPLGRELYWFTVTPIEEAEEGTDRWAVEQGWVSLTPLRLDLTDERQLESHARAARSTNPLLSLFLPARHQSRPRNRSVRTRPLPRSRGRRAVQADQVFGESWLALWTLMREGFRMPGRVIR